MMKNAIITGATSFIGVHLIQELLKNDFCITAIIRPHSMNIDRLPVDERVNVIELDSNDIHMLPEKIRESQYDLFYHLAWEGVRVPYRDDERIQEINYNNALKAMDVANELRCKVFISSGSQAEYGKCIGKIEEGYSTHPTSEYGKAKLKTYDSLSELSNKYHIKFIWTRIFSVYGRYDYSGTLVMSALKKMLRDEELDLTECNQNWDYVHVVDTARAMYLLGVSECADGIYNIASGKTKKLKEFVLDMKRITKSNSNINFGVIPYGSEGIVDFEPVIHKLNTTIDFEPRINFEQGIFDLLQYIR